MSEAARRIRILVAVSKAPAPPDELLHAIMRGEVTREKLAQLVTRLDPEIAGQEAITKLSEPFLTDQLREITGDETITLQEFEQICADVRRQASLN